MSRRLRVRGYPGRGRVRARGAGALQARQCAEDVRHEDTQEVPHRGHQTTGTRHEREEHHARLSLPLHRIVSTRVVSHLTPSNLLTSERANYPFIITSHRIVRTN